MTWWYACQEMLKLTLGLLDAQVRYNSCFNSISISKFHSIFNKILACFNLSWREIHQTHYFLGQCTVPDGFSQWIISWFYQCSQINAFSTGYGAAGPREQMNFLSSLQISRRPFLLLFHNSSPSLSPTHSVSPKQINNCTALLNPRACFLATNHNSLLDRQPWNNVFITLLLFQHKWRAVLFICSLDEAVPPHMCAGPHWDGIQATHVCKHQ